MSPCKLLSTADLHRVGLDCGSTGSDVTPRSAILDEPEGRKPGPLGERNRQVDADTQDAATFLLFLKHTVTLFTGLNSGASRPDASFHQHLAECQPKII